MYDRSACFLYSQAAMAAEGEIFTEEDIAYLRIHYGLDDPWMVQYFNWIRDIILHGDFGYSFECGRDVWSVIMDRLRTREATGTPSATAPPPTWRPALPAASAAAWRALPAILALIDDAGVVQQVSYGTPMGRESRDFYKKIEM